MYTRAAQPLQWKHRYSTSSTVVRALPVTMNRPRRDGAPSISSPQFAVLADLSAASASAEVVTANDEVQLAELRPSPLAVVNDVLLVMYAAMPLMSPTPHSSLQPS